MDELHLEPAEVKALASTRFLSLYDLSYDDGGHYFVASRRKGDDLLALKDADALAATLPDAVSCCLALEVAGKEPRMVLFYEYRYPTGQYLLSIPSGLVDPRDCVEGDPLVTAMTRELREECGVVLGEGDDIWVINPFLYNTPGLTDESTALLCAVARRAEDVALAHPGAEGTERFGGFELLTKDEVREVLRRGCDRYGRRYPMVAWAAMSYFAYCLEGSGA